MMVLGIDVSNLKFPAPLLLPCLFFQGLKRFWRNRLLSTPRVERGERSSARAVIRGAERKPSANPWLSKLVARRNKNVAAVALANKNARTIWALLAHDRQYEAGYGLAT